MIRLPAAEAVNTAGGLLTAAAVHTAGGLTQVIQKSKACFEQKSNILKHYAHDLSCLAVN
jgi:hypothetical protein